MQLKLAEYNADGKFERFLEFSSDGDWKYCGNAIEVYDSSSTSVTFNIYDWHLYMLDEKDPLNRFDGLFDGRTYGNGRFILIESEEDDIEVAIDTKTKEVLGYGLRGRYLTLSPRRADSAGYVNFNFYKEIAGNLHSNPELWEKVK